MKISINKKWVEINKIQNVIEKHLYNLREELFNLQNKVELIQVGIVSDLEDLKKTH